jgi:hypothetical protein
MDWPKSLTHTFMAGSQIIRYSGAGGSESVKTLQSDIELPAEWNSEYFGRLDDYRSKNALIHRMCGTRM